MLYNWNMNLQQKAALRVAITFWEKREVKHHVMHFFMSFIEFNIHEVRSKWRKLIKSLFEEWNNNVLPHKLNVELTHVVKMMGEIIYDWYQYIKHEYPMNGEAIYCIDKIFWSCFGLDEVKTLKFFWLKNPNTDIIKKYHFVCTFAFEKDINDLWSEIPKDMQDNCFNDVCKCFDTHIFAYWKCRRDNSLPNLMSYLLQAADNFNIPNRNNYIDTWNHLYGENCSVEQNMLRLSVYKCYHVAVKYFWEKIIDQEKSQCVLGCARIAVRMYKNLEETDASSTTNYLKQKYVEICIFLINQMGINLKELFFNEIIILNRFNIINIKKKILIMLLYSWPWQQQFIPALNDMLQYQYTNSIIDCTFIITEIIHQMVEDHRLDYAIKFNKYRYLLRETWFLISKFINEDTLIMNSNEIIHNLLKVRDIDNLKLILNDPNIANLRDEFINSGFYSYKKLISKKQFEILDQFIEEIFISEEERKHFKQMIFYF